MVEFSTEHRERDDNETIVAVTIPADMLEAARMVESDRRQELAVLASRDIPMHYGVEDFEADLETLRSLGRS